MFLILFTYLVLLNKEINQAHEFYEFIDTIGTMFLFYFWAVRMQDLSHAFSHPWFYDK